jgi:hypothetical protein
LGYSVINIGLGNVIARDRIVCIVAPGSAPIKKLRDAAREKGKLIDASQGRRTRAVIVTDSDHVVLSAISIDTIAQRVNEQVVQQDAQCAEKP